MIIQFSDEVVNSTIEIRKLHKIKTPDAIIAASAKISDLGLITRNVKDFSGLNLIEVLNPWDF